MSRDNDEESEEAPVKVHEIKFDEYGIMDDGLDASTNEQLKTLQGEDSYTIYILWKLLKKCLILEDNLFLLCSINIF